MKFRDCKDCGKYKFIKSDGLCRNCFSNKLYIDKVDSTLPNKMVNRTENIVQDKFSSYDTVYDESYSTHILKLRKNRISIVLDNTETTILEKKPITNINPKRYTALIINALESFKQ